MKDRPDTIRRGLALLAVLVIVVLFIVALFDDRTAKPMPPNGDMLGMDTGESFEQYRERAAASLAAAPADDEVFALVTFTGPQTPTAAGELLEPVGRVNAMIVDLAPPYPLPEPVEGENRADVFERELGRIGDSLAGIGNVPTPDELDAVVVWDDGDVLRELAGEGEVAAVETLPPDAAWGRFGVRPVQVPEQQ